VTSVATDPTIRRQVMAAAREVLGAQPNAPIEEITRRAGVSRATFYRHFGSRDALLDSIAHERRPVARERILAAAQDMLIRHSLADLSMDDLARAAEVSRGTLYRLYPGKSALMESLIQAYSPFEQVQAIIRAGGNEPPAELLPKIAREVVGTAGQRLGLLRAVFFEVSGGSEAAISGMRTAFSATIGLLGEYMVRQMAAGRVRRMHPVLAVQAFIGPVFFHLLTRAPMERLVRFDIPPAEAADQLVAVIVAGLEPEGTEGGSE
jgi:AcrR family transcriptional regulator